MDTPRPGTGRENGRTHTEEQKAEARLDTTYSRRSLSSPPFLRRLPERNQGPVQPVTSPIFASKRGKRDQLGEEWGTSRTSSSPSRPAIRGSPA